MMNHLAVKVQQVGLEVHLHAPRVPGLHAAVRELGGVAGPDAVYMFPLASLNPVHDLCERLYGNRGYVDLADVLTLQINLGRIELNPWYAEQQSNPETSDYTNAIRVGGRLIAVRPFANAGVHLGAGVELVAGEFEPTAGEPGAPILGALDDVIVHVYDLLRTRFDSLPSYSGMEITELRTTAVELDYDVLREQARVGLYARYGQYLKMREVRARNAAVKPTVMDTSA